MLKYKLKLCEYEEKKITLTITRVTLPVTLVHVVKVQVKLCEYGKKENNFNTKLVQKTSQLTTEFESL